MGSRRQHNKGASLTSYGLAVGLISIVALGAVTSIGDQANNLFGNVGDTLIDAQPIGESTASGSPSPAPDSCASSPSLGDVCSDGTVYAGISPDSGTAMYVPRCDAGQSYNQVSGLCECDAAWIHSTNNLSGDPNTATCGTTITQYSQTYTIERSGIPWNNGTNNWRQVGILDLIAGQANTTALLSIDSATGGTGTDPHLAAEYCDGLTLHGKSDWFLPAQDELLVVAGNKSSGALNDTFDLSGTYPTGYYRTSSEYNGVSGSVARSIVMSSGTVDTARGKNWLMSVRCVRTD